MKQDLLDEYVYQLSQSNHGAAQDIWQERITNTLIEMTRARIDRRTIKELLDEYYEEWLKADLVSTGDMKAGV